MDPWNRHDSVDRPLSTAAQRPLIDLGSLTSRFRVVASGRRRVAGWLVCGGGLAVALSAFLPWVSVIGLISAGIGATAVLILLALGGGLTYLGGQVLLGRTARWIRVSLWVLATIDLVLVVALFQAQQAVGMLGGLVQPGAGFYFALLGLIATLVGTIAMQSAAWRGTQPMAPDATGSSHPAPPPPPAPPTPLAPSAPSTSSTPIVPSTPSPSAAPPPPTFPAPPVRTAPPTLPARTAVPRPPAPTAPPVAPGAPTLPARPVPPEPPLSRIPAELWAGSSSPGAAS